MRLTASVHGSVKVGAVGQFSVGVNSQHHMDRGQRVRPILGRSLYRPLETGSRIMTRRIVKLAGGLQVRGVRRNPLKFRADVSRQPVWTNSAG